MISIEAVIRPERVGSVTAALEAVGCQGFYYYNVTGQGRQRGVEVFVGRGGSMASRSSVPKTLVRTVVNDDLQEAVVNAIIDAARSPEDGEIGDGKIFISPVADLVRVRTGERGEAAI
ncbi:MAG: P-II family nitrogen regulator [SAR202 cluster bacterium]|nr:P-II family nitrogen regulator [SAR202 cluster bacterium]|tara:strand:+ start:1499 stop:1852 length:354 start_codon:yes stop_codon:yes gene_type:complete